MELIRGKGGAYGVGATVDVMEQVFSSPPIETHVSVDRLLIW